MEVLTLLLGAPWCWGVNTELGLTAALGGTQTLSLARCPSAREIKHLLAGFGG